MIFKTIQLACVLWALSTTLLAEDNPVSKPNIIVILADDLGYGDVGYQGCQDIPTTHIDSIAHQGASFSAAYSAAPVCGPSRAGLLTGKYQNRFGYQDNIGPFGRDHQVELGTPTDIKLFPEYLSQHGYITGMIGKWHDGDAEKFWPHKRGFDESYCFNNGAANYFIGKDNGKSEKYGAVHRNGVKLKAVDDYLTDDFGREAVDFVERHRDRPFFLYLSFNAVHGPLQAPKRYLKHFKQIKDEKRRTMAAMHYAMDLQIGNLLNTLKKHALEENTLVIFTSDNGGKPKGNASLNGPLRGQKGQTWDGGIRVPFCVQWKGTIPAGRQISDPIHSIDILRTALASAKIQNKPEWQLEGVDLMPIMTGQTNSLEHRYLYFRLNTNWAIRDHQHKLVSMDQKLWFSHIAEDISEKKNLIRKKPELVEAFQTKMKSWDAQNEPARWGWNRNTCETFIGYRNFKTIEDLENAQKKKKGSKRK